MASVLTLTSKPLDLLCDYLERQANSVNPYAVELATERINELKRVLEEGGTCPYTDKYISCDS